MNDPNSPATLDIDALSAGNLLMMEAALAVAEERGLLNTDQLREIHSAVSTLSRVLELPPSSIPLAPLLLRPLLKRVVPQRFRVGRKRWSNVRSAIVTLAIAVDLHEPRWPRRFVVPAPWNAQYRAVPVFHRGFIVRFIRFCAVQGIAPELVDDATVQRFKRHVEERSYSPHPRGVVWRCVGLWNRFAGTVPGWPTQRLTPPRKDRKVARPITAYSSAFQEDLRRYLSLLNGADPFAEGAPARPLSTVTIDERRRAFLRAASILVDSGTDLQNIRSLADLVTPVAMRTVLLRLHEHNGRRWTGFAKQVAGYLLHLARSYVRPNQEQISELERIWRKIPHAAPGLTQRARNRLAAFESPVRLRRLFDAPEQAVRLADRRLDSAPVRAAHLHEAAIALQVLVHTALRRRNLIELDIRKHFVRGIRGRITSLRIPGEETKNGRPIDWDVPAAVATRLDRHITVFRPHLPGAGQSSFLFPGAGGRHRNAETIARAIKALVRDYVGAQFTPHLARHIMATLLYADNPSNGAIVQRALGHVSIQTAEKMYGIARSSGALAVLDEVIKRRLQRRIPSRSPSRPRGT
jgi:integrase